MYTRKRKDNWLRAPRVDANRECALSYITCGKAPPSRRGRPHPLLAAAPLALILIGRLRAPRFLFLMRVNYLQLIRWATDREKRRALRFYLNRSIRRKLSPRTPAHAVRKQARGQPTESAARRRCAPREEPAARSRKWR